jgi:hypothetical protein
LIPKGEGSGLQTHIATTESVSVVHTEEKLTAFMELEAATHARDELVDKQARFPPNPGVAKRILIRRRSFPRSLVPPPPDRQSQNQQAALLQIHSKF